MQGNQRAARDVTGSVFGWFAHVQHQRFGFLIQFGLYGGRFNAGHGRPNNLLRKLMT